MIAHERLLEVIDYDKTTGYFTWKVDNKYSQTRSGDSAGWISGSGYRYITIDMCCYSAHRLAWFYVEGYWSENEIDHINLDRLDNSWSNLREVSKQCNLKNKSVYKNNKSGVSGVQWHSKNKKWRAVISIKGKHISLGFYDDILSAAKARLIGEKRYWPDKCLKNSSAYKYIKEHDFNLLYRCDNLC